MLCPRSKSKARSNDTVVLSTPYSVEFKEIYRIIDKNIPILLLDPHVNEVFKNGYRCVAKKAPTFRDTLSPSLFTSVSPKKPTWLNYKGSYCCGHKRCICCSVMEPTTEIRSFSNGTKHLIFQYINCNTKNIIYLIL